MARNLKLFNHWIAEVRELALKKNLHKELESGKKVPLTKSDIKFLFDRGSFYGTFEDGAEPLEALENELDYWEPA